MKRWHGAKQSRGVNRRQIAYAALISALLAVLCLFLLDKPIAAFVQSVGGPSSVVLRRGTSLLELLSGFPVARYFVSFVLVAAAIVLLIWRRTHQVAWLVMFVASANLASRVVAGVVKVPVGRLRPFEVIANGTWDPLAFFKHGSAFPSGHVAHFWGLFFPLALLFPRYRIPLLLIPLFIAIARVGVNEHWCSDVFASISIAALLTLLFAWLFRINATKTDAAAVVPVAEN